MDFDRCNGEFSNPASIYNNASSDSLLPATGCTSLEFSPNGRFIYVSNNINLVQYDLAANNIQDSAELYLEDSASWYGIAYLQLAVNGKVYGSTFDGGLYALNVINQPDLKGASANFLFGGQPTLTVNSVNVPNLINYRLGPLLGSGCDTLGTTDTTKTGAGIVGLTKNNQLRIMPNPAAKYIYVEMGMQGDYEFELVNANGQVVSSKETPQVDIFDTEHLANGVYFLRVIDKNTGAEVAGRVVVVVH